MPQAEKTRVIAKRMVYSIISMAISILTFQQLSATDSKEAARGVGQHSVIKLLSQPLVQLSLYFAIELTTYVKYTKKETAICLKKTIRTSYL